MRRKSAKKSIVTKAGDGGKTFLASHVRVFKDEARVNFVGELDELSSFLGLVKAKCRQKKYKKFIEAIQKDLFIIAAETSGRPATRAKVESDFARPMIESLETAIEELEDKVYCGNFVFAGADVLSSFTHMARAIARRAERAAVTLYRKKLLNNKNIIAYLNRLSDALFILALVFSRKKS
jgi:cob(I)alamin adenosyltransferase